MMQQTSNKMQNIRRIARNQ